MLWRWELTSVLARNTLYPTIAPEMVTN